jgi:hypothetical protein
MMISFYPKAVKGYGYRQAQVKGGMVIKPELKEYDKLLRRFSLQAGIRPDNHVLFVADGLAVQFDDGEISVSAEYVVSRW